MKSNVNKVAAAIFGAAVMMCAVTSATAAGEYTSAQLAISDVGGGYDNGISFVGTFGMPLPQIHKNVAFEAELSKALIKPEYIWFGTRYDVDYYSLGGYCVFSVPATVQLNFRLRLGLAYSHETWETWGFSGSDSDVGLTLGAGVTFALQKNMNLIAEYTTIDNNMGDIDHLSAGLQFKF